jgi:hypothetical protein
MVSLGRARGKESPRRIRAVVVMRHRLGDHGFRFNFDFDLGSLFELYLLSICVGETVWNTDLSIEVICSLDGNLSFFGFARAGMRMDYLFDFPWERSTRFRRFTRHNDPPLPFGSLFQRILGKNLEAMNHNCLRGFK